MDLLGGYDSENSGNEEPVVEATESSNEIRQQSVPVVVRPDRRFLNAAPSVSALAVGSSSAAAGSSSALSLVVGNNSTSSASLSKQKNGDLILMNNPTKALLYQPVQGPQGMDPQNQLASKPSKHESDFAFDEETFHEQRKAFQRSSRALAPDEQGSLVVRTTLGYDSERLRKFAATEEQRRKRARPNPASTGGEALVYGDNDEVEHGIWAPPSKEERWAAENSLSDVARGGVESLAPEQLAEREYIQERNRQRGIEQEKRDQGSSFERLIERKMSHLLPPKLDDDATAMEASTTFHGDAEFDYKGQSWIAPPAGMGAALEDDVVDMDHHKCYVPKKCVHRFSASNKGVHRIRLFPRTGHLLLTAQLDGSCKVFSLETKKLMRTYTGHSAAVRDVQFNHDGKRFVSCSFDRFLRLWNTETGQVEQTFTNRKVPYVIQFYPHDDNLFVVGCSDNKIVTYNCTNAEITQEYNHHLAPVNAIVFVEDHGTKMVTSSDDKTVLVWEWDIGVPIKYISDPTMHSMPSMQLHPSGQYFCGQSLDNHIAVFQATNRFAAQRKKKFSGHQIAGYACEMAFSPDGQYLTSGDGNGRLFFWDWKRATILQKYRAHDKGPAICCVWHPLEPSVMFTCGWDGVIKMWK